MGDSIELTVLSWVFTAAALLVVVVGIAAGRGAIAHNSFVGIRTPALKRSDAAWRAGHAASVLPGAVAFLVSLGCAVVGLFVPTGDLWAT